MVFSLKRLRLLPYLHNHTNELCQGPDLHFFHHAGAMDFNSALTDSQVTRDDLVGFPLNDQLKGAKMPSSDSIGTHPMLSIQLISQTATP